MRGRGGVSPGVAKGGGGRLPYLDQNEIFTKDMVFGNVAADPCVSCGLSALLLQSKAMQLG